MQQLCTKSGGGCFLRKRGQTHRHCYKGTAANGAEPSLEAGVAPRRRANPGKLIRPFVLSQSAETKARVSDIYTQTRSLFLLEPPGPSVLGTACPGIDCFSVQTGRLTFPTSTPKRGKE